MYLLRWHHHYHDYRHLTSRLNVNLTVSTARRVCIARAMPSQDVCLSVRLSVTRRYCVSTIIHILKFFSPSGSPTILVFLHQTGWQYSNGGVECKGVWKNHGFRPISRFISEMMQDRVIYYGRQIENRTHASEWYQFEWPWVTSDPDSKVMISVNVK